MTTTEIIGQLGSLIRERKIFLDGTDDETYIDDIAALTAAIEAINTSSEGKLYTVFEIIRLVQEAVSEEICGLDDGGIGMLVAYEVERGIIRKLVKEDAK